MSALRARSFRVRRAVFVAPIGSPLPLHAEGTERLTCEHGVHVCLPCGHVYMPGSMSIDKPAPRRFDPERVSFELVCERDDIEPRGNCCGCDDGCGCLETIYDRLDRGDVWAWCWVKITATYEDEELGELACDDSLGGCNFKDEADFMQCHGHAMQEELTDQLRKLVDG